jgi:3-ketosteroid 9alpha-monooxygenase subunit A
MESATYPRGWFILLCSEELAKGEHKSVEYFGQRLVVFRSETGEVSALDAYCPHLGADLGVGGKVVGDTIKCPFHAWRFDGQGQCVDIPYAEKIPKRACVRSWQLEEVNGFVFVWHAPPGVQPDYRIPVIPEYEDDEWTSWSMNIRTIETHPREIVENVADRGHFSIVHGTHIDKFANEFIDHMAIQHSEGVAYPRGGGKDDFKLKATYYGPAYQITEMDSALPNRLVNAHTPISENKLHLRFGVMLKKITNDDRMEQFAQKYIENLQTGFAEDVQIWEHKVYRAQPKLCDGDGPIGKLRRWYGQFYELQQAAGAK